MQHPIRATVKVGFLTLLSLLVLVSTIIWLRGRWLAGGDHYNVSFNDVDGMRSGAPVQFMGIRVGFVDEILPTTDTKHHYVVKVRFTISEKNVIIPKGAILSIQQSGLIGEKYLEITPPKAYEATLWAESALHDIQPGTPLLVQFEDGEAKVGEIRKVIVNKERTANSITKPYRHLLSYWLVEPGYHHSSNNNIVYKSTPNGVKLFLDDPFASLIKRPKPGMNFVLEDPLRLKFFLEKQLASAEALQETNEKINRLLNDETIENIQETLKNTELLTERTNQVLDHADQLFISANKDMHSLVASADKLSKGVVSLTGNLDSIAKDPELKKDLRETIRNINTTSHSLAQIMDSSELKAILSDTEVSADNVAAITQSIRKTIVEDHLPEKITQTTENLDESLTKLKTLLTQVNAATEDEQYIKNIMSDVEKTSNNLRRFSSKLNKPFLLLRLLLY